MTTPSAMADQGALSGLLEPIRAKYNIPALAAAVVRDGRIVAAGAVGVRRAGSSSAVTLDDKFHIGSVTKSMTATLAAILIADGRIRGDTSLAEAFPELAVSMHPALRGVTLAQLLAHRGGLIGGKLLADPLWTALVAYPGSTAEARSWFVSQLLLRPPENAPGVFEYSNAGYTVAGRMLEVATGRTWEDLIRTFLFSPLKLDSAGFGAPASPGQLDQPWGHLADGTVVPPGLGSDNPEAIGPAGTVHMSIRDLARFAALHLRGHLEGDALLPRDAFRALHASADGRNPTTESDLAYGLGWFVTTRPWALPDYVYEHGGSNSTFMASIELVPSRNLAVVVAANIPTAAVEEANDLLTAYYRDLPFDVAGPLVSGSAQLYNLSTRAATGPGENVSITGFTIAGSTPKTILIRAAGPSLANFGVSDPLVDPQLEVFAMGENERFAANDNWSDNSLTPIDDLVAVTQRVGAFSFTAGAKDSTLLLTLAPGGYSAVARGGTSAYGTSLAEIYDASPGVPGKLANLSARVSVREGGDTAICGVVIVGTDTLGLLIRAVGPTLGEFGVANPLFDPVLALVDHEGRIVASNDDWHESIDRGLILAATKASGAFPLAVGSRDAAIVRVLSPGLYTVLVHDRLNRAGVALVEAYALPAGILMPVVTPDTALFIE